MDFFKRHFMVPLIAVLGLVAIAYIGVKANLQLVFGVIIPYLAILIFVEGLIYQSSDGPGLRSPLTSPLPAPKARPCPGSKETWQRTWTTPRTPSRLSAVWPWKSWPCGPCSGTPGRNCRETGETRRRPADALVLQMAMARSDSLSLRFPGNNSEAHAFFRRTGAPLGGGLVAADGFVQFYIPTVYLTGVCLVVAALYLLARRIYTPTVALHLPGCGLLPPDAYHRHRRYRHFDALYL